VQPATTAITVPQFSRLVGLPDAPAIIDVRIEGDFAGDPRMLPASMRRDSRRPHSGQATSPAELSSWCAKRASSYRKASRLGSGTKGRSPSSWRRLPGMA
jgi:hypothetical protein